MVYIAKEQTFVVTVGPSGHLIYPNPITYSLRSFCLRQEQGKKLGEEKDMKPIPEVKTETQPKNNWSLGRTKDNS